MFTSSDTSTIAWGCSKCKGDEFEEGDKYRSIRNCDDETSENIAWDWMPSLRRCPWSQLDPAALTMFSWWVEWKDFGVMPWTGSDLLLQPAFVMEAIALCQQLKTEIENDTTKRQNAEIERLQNKAKKER